MRALIIGVLLVLASVAPLAAGPGTLRPFSTIEVMEIENKRNAQGKKLPDEWVPRVREQIRYAVGSQHLFHRVEDQVDAMVKGEDTGRTIRLQVRITDFSGVQTQPTIKAAVVFLDKATGERDPGAKRRRALVFRSGCDNKCPHQAHEQSGRPCEDTTGSARRPGARPVGDEAGIQRPAPRSHPSAVMRPSAAARRRTY